MYSSAFSILTKTDSSSHSCKFKFRFENTFRYAIERDTQYFKGFIRKLEGPKSEYDSAIEREEFLYRPDLEVDQDYLQISMTTLTTLLQIQ